MVANRCQYWNVYEPLQCVYWDEGSFTCGYVNTKTEALIAGEDVGDIVSPSYAPHCNYIGTMVSCTHYKSPSPGTYQPRCMLPDPTRHVCNRWTGKKWVSLGSSEIEPGSGLESSSVPDFSPINGYNDGQCDGFGTSTTCSGYTPSHMGFGRLVPSNDYKHDISREANTFSTIMEFDYRLPLHFSVFNLRAQLSKCMWWEGDYAPFTVNSGTRMIELSGEWACKNENDVSAYEDFSAENGAPCNGCKPECPHYSGVCWEYCIDELLGSGDPVLAEQVHELRYYCKENQWTAELIENYFGDQGHLYTWGGSHVITDNAGVLHGDMNYTVNSRSNTIEEYEIPSVKTSMSNFNTLTIDTEDLVLSKGTEVEGELRNFPDKVTEFSLIQLGPIIKNRFETEGVFETTKLGGVPNVTIYGKVFYSSEVFAINISHEDVASSIPNELFEFDSLYDIRLTYGTTAYNNFYEQYEKTIALLRKLVVNSENINQLSDEGVTTFVLEAPLYPKRRLYRGTNTIAVFQYTDSGLLFSKIDVEKCVVGGALIQNDFVMRGDGIPVRTLYDYTDGFWANKNEGTGSMAFDFVPFSIPGKSYEIVHYYDDTYFGGSGGIIYSGYKYYKIYMDEYILTGPSEVSDGYTCEYFNLGDDGYYLVVLDILELNRIFEPWEFESIEATYEDGSTCEFEAVFSGADNDAMEVNQLIIKPKNGADFKSLCNATIVIKELAYYQKFSFDELPDTGWSYELMDDDSEDSTINYNRTNYIATWDKHGVSMSDFQFTMTPSILIGNSAGRPFTLFRTKPIGWVKQPKCPAVEIYYRWMANYTRWTNVPVCVCCGPAKQVDGRPSGHSQTPPCGDHDLSSFSGIGPMWWPFTACDTYLTYSIISNLDYYSYDVVGIFKETNEDGNKLHGNHDMRMVGPPTYTAGHGRGCNFLMACRCNWRTHGDKKNGDNVFAGHGTIRSGVDDGQLKVWYDEGEALPKFGNSFRPQLDSYLTIERTQYQYTSDGSSWSTGWRLMPAFMGFSKADFLDNSDVPMWSYSASTVANAAPVCNPLGFFTAASFEGVSINETVDYVNRFTLDEICHARAITDKISYPSVNGTYTSVKSEGRVMPWYEFKPYSPSGSGSGGSTIQWAWQEVWQPLERMTSETQSKSSFIRAFMSAGNTSNSVPTLGGPFVAGNDGNTGMFKFLNVDHSSYLYNYKTEEFTTVCSEGEHYLKLIAPEKDESTGEYLGYIKIQLDGGPERGISWDSKAWLTEDNVSTSIPAEDEEYNFEVYKEFTGENGTEVTGDSEESCWYNGVTLFDSNCPTKVDGAMKSAEDAGRMVESYYVDTDEKTITKKTHFQTGLLASINPAGFTGDNLPTTITSVGYNTNEQNYVGDGAGQTVLVCGTGVVGTSMASFDSKVKSITAAEITFTVGAVPVEGTEFSEEPMYNFYHVPAVSVYASSDGTTKETLLYENGVMEFHLDSSEVDSVDTKTYIWNNSLEYLLSGSLYVIIELRATPTDAELAALTAAELAIYNKSINYVSYSVFDVYEAILTNAVEPITTWERKYYVSYGDCGDSPPQGKDPENTSTLYVRGMEKSTPYTKDTRDGVMGMDGSDSDNFNIMSKTRCRILGELHVDGEPLSGDVWEMEKQQKKLFDEAFAMSDPYAVMAPVVPPSLSKVFSEEGISFFGPHLTLENTLMAELAEINAFDPINGEGHQYIADYSCYDPKCALFCDGPESCMTWQYTCMDENANGSYTGQANMNAGWAFYWGTYNYLQRRDAAEATIENVFNKKYGGSSDTKIWVDNKQSELYFPECNTKITGVSSSTVNISYNLEYFKLSMNWQNAYFNVAENYEPEGPSTVN